MIVVDTNVVVSLYLPTVISSDVGRLFARDPPWVAPRLWRSELRSALALYLRKRLVSLEQALHIQNRAKNLFVDREYDVASVDVPQLVAATDCSAYDCEFVALAGQLRTRLVTADRKLLRTFPDIAEPPDSVAP